MVDTLNQPKEVFFNGNRYQLTGGKYYIESHTRNRDRKGVKGLHVAIWEYYHNEKVPKDCCIHHIDGNPFNNSLENLKMVKRKEHSSKHSKERMMSDGGKQVKESLEMARKAAANWHKSKEGLEWHQKNKNNYSKPVIKCDLKGSELKRYNSIKEASDDTGICFSSIGKCAKGKQKTSGGYKWKYA